MVMGIAWPSALTPATRLVTLAPVSPSAPIRVDPTVTAMATVRLSAQIRVSLAMAMAIVLPAAMAVSAVTATVLALSASISALSFVTRVTPVRLQAPPTAVKQRHSSKHVSQAVNASSVK